MTCVSLLGLQRLYNNQLINHSRRDIELPPFHAASTTVKLELTGDDTL